MYEAPLIFTCRGRIQKGSTLERRFRELANAEYGFSDLIWGNMIRKITLEQKARHTISTPVFIPGMYFNICLRPTAEFNGYGGFNPAEGRD